MAYETGSKVNPNQETGSDGKLTLYETLSGQYRDVLFTSLVTSFGLDAILFRNDDANGHVDTIHNVVESAKDGKAPVFKSAQHLAAYEGRGDYKEVKDAYHQHPDYINKGKEWNALRDAGLLVDAYTGQPIEPGQKYDRDHVVSAKSIHDDPRRALSGLDGVELANQDSNLQPTSRSINRSKGADTAEDFIARLEKKRQDHLLEAQEIKAAIKAGTAEEGAHKRLASLEARLAADADLMQKATDKAKRSQSRQHNSAYYMSRDFLGTTASYAVKAGFRMGLRQGLGMVMLELSAAVQEELPAVMQRWRETQTWQEKLDPRPVLEHIVAILKRAWEGVQLKFAHIFSEIKDGFIAGALSEIVTTVINIFTGTAKRVMKMLREFWSSIVSALRILVHNPDNLGETEKLAAVMKLMSVAVGGIVQPIIAEAVDKLLLSTLPLDFLREPLALFAGAAVGGIISVSLVYAIDHSPLVKGIVEVMRQAGAMTQAVYQRIGEITSISWKLLQNGVERVTDYGGSPTVNLVAFITCPPLGLALHFDRRFNQTQNALTGLEQGQGRIEGKLQELGTSMDVRFGVVEQLFRESNALLGCVIEGQERQTQLLMEIRKEMQKGFTDVQKSIRSAITETAELVAVHDLQKTLNQLVNSYRDCAGSLKRGKTPLPRDLMKIEDLAGELIAQFQASFERQPEGAPARLALLNGMAFALGVWRDARIVLEDSQDIFPDRAKLLSGLARKELLALTNGAGLWQLAQEQAWLVSQYVLLRRSLTGLLSGQDVFADHFDESWAPELPAYNLLAWNDGLQPMRDALTASEDEAPLEVLNLRTHEARQSWRQLAGLPVGLTASEIKIDDLRKCLGIPDNVSLGASAIELLKDAPEMLEYHRLTLESALA